MKKLTVALILFQFFTSSYSFAQTDQACANDCLNRGYNYNLCQQRCSYNQSQGDVDTDSMNQAAETYRRLAKDRADREIAARQFQQQQQLNQQLLRQQQLQNEQIEMKNSLILHCQAGEKQACNTLQSMSK